jgi:signal peptidase I
MIARLRNVAARGARARWAAGWLLVVAVVVLAWPVQLGGRFGLVVVSGHSMDGTYRTGDLLMTWRHSAYDVGDIAVYRIPDAGPAHGLRVVHRIVGHTDGGFLMRGDNRTSNDIWHPSRHDVVGSPVLRLPGGGLALRWLFNPLALAMLCAGCVFLLVSGSGGERSVGESSAPEPVQSDPAPRLVS